MTQFIYQGGSQNLVSGTLDFTTGLGYAWFYQPIIGYSAEMQFKKILLSLHRRYKCAKHCEMRI